MVGLYHKRRASRSSSSKLLRFFIRLSFILGVFIVVGFTLTALFFNGSQVKGPLSIYLSSKFNMEVSIGDAEFSPIYPDVIKLYNVTFGKSKIGELYVEYDLRSAMGSDELRITDLYLNKINIDPNDLLTVANSKLGFNSIRAQTARFYGTPLRTTFLNAPSATVRLENVTYSAQEGLTFRSGALSTGQARLFNDEVKSFNIEFTHNDKGIAINNFSAGILGGTVTGHGTYNIISNEHKSLSDGDIPSSNTPPISAEISLDELNLSKVIINQGLRAPKNVKLSARKTNLTDVIFTNNILGNQSEGKKPSEQSKLFAKPNSKSTPAPITPEESESQYLSYIMQGINGTIDDLYIDHDDIEGMFEGHIDEISFPNLQTTFENNNAIASFENNKMEFDLKGNLYEGTFNSIGSLDLTKKRLSVTELRMSKNKLALNRPRLDFIKKQFSDHSLFIKNAKFNQLEFLSYINSLPLSIQSISGTANNIFVHPTVLKDLETKISQAQNNKTPKHKHNQNNIPDEVDNFYKILSYLTLDDKAIAESKEESLNLSKHKFMINPDIYSDSQDNRNVIKDNSLSSLNLNLINMLYSNLLMSDTKVNLKLDENGLAIDVPKMRFKESSLSAQAYLALQEKLPSKFTLKAKDFESADLNSNLIGHMLTGKINLDLDIESACADKINNIRSLLSHSDGNISLNSSAMLIADFGLDLINGGNSDSYKLSTTELLSAIQGSVAGINNLKAQAQIVNGEVNINSTASLVTSNLSLNSKVNINEDSISGRAYLISRSKDSSTQVTISGNMDDPIFNIKALRRGEKRPGLYLPQYQNTAVAKEQTDAASVLKGKIAAPATPTAAASAAAAGAAVDGKQEQEAPAKPEVAEKPESSANSDSKSSEAMSTAIEGKQELMTDGAAKPEGEARNESSANSDSKSSKAMSTAVEGKQELITDGAAKPESTANSQNQNSQNKVTATEGKQELMTDGAAKPEGEAKSESTANGQNQNSLDKGAAIEGKQELMTDGAAKPEGEAKPESSANSDSKSSEAMSTAVEGKQEPMMDGAAKSEGEAMTESTANSQNQNSLDKGAAVEGKQEPMTEGAAKTESTANGQNQNSQDKGAAVEGKQEHMMEGAAGEDSKHAQDMLEEEHQALNRQKQLENQANATEMELLKDALIDSIISKPHNNYEEEELIF